MSRACVFINSNDPTIRNQLINTISFIKPKFPPKIDLRELITKHTYADSNRPSNRAPNAFIIYRKAFVDAAKQDGYQLPMTIVSSLSSQSWDLEPDFVKEEYKKLAKEANSLRKKLIPKLGCKKKRQKWNIITFPPPPSTSSSSSSAINKSKTVAKEKKVEIKETSLSPPNPLPPEISFHIPCDITSQIIDTEQQQQHQQNYFNTQSSVEFDTYQQVVDTFAAVDNTFEISTTAGYINNEFEYESPGFLTFFNNFYGISYPSFWQEY